MLTPYSGTVCHLNIGVDEMALGCKNGVDQMGQNAKSVDEMGVDQMGLDEMGINRRLIQTVVYMKVCDEVSECIVLMPSNQGHGIFKWFIISLWAYINVASVYNLNNARHIYYFVFDKP